MLTRAYILMLMSLQIFTQAEDNVVLEGMQCCKRKEKVKLFVLGGKVAMTDRCG